MRTLLEACGWEPVEIRRSGTMDPYVLEWMSRMEGKGIDWSRSMAPRFPGFMAWKLIWETHFLRRREGLGILTAVARPR